MSADADIATLGLEVDSRPVNRARDDLGKFKRATDDAASGATKMEQSWGKVRNVLAGLALGATIAELVKMADSATLLDARLRNVAGSQEAFNALQSDAYRIAQKSNAGYAETIQLMTRLHEPVKRLGGTTRETSMITEAFAASLRVGGASAMEAASATLQFAQAMGSGKLQGDEFKAIAEASPRFMKALAEGMNVPIEKLKEMGSEGKLTAEVVGNALMKSLGSLQTEMRNIPDTVGGAFQRITNDVKLMVHDLNTRGGITLGIADVIESIRTDLLPLVRDGLREGFATVKDWVEKNKDELVLVWNLTKGIVSTVWDIAKAAGAVTIGITQWSVEAGLLSATLVGIRTFLAGIQDGVKVIGAGMVWLGSQFIQFVMKPIVEYLDVVSKVGGFFDEKLGASVAQVAANMREFATSGQVYAEKVFDDMSRGKSAFGEMTEELRRNAAAAAASKTMTLDQVRALELAGYASAGAAGKFKPLVSTVKELSKEQEQAAKSFKSWMDGIKNKIAELDKEAELGRDLNDAEKESIKLKTDLATKYKALNPEITKGAQALLDSYSAKLKEKEADEANLKLQDELRKLRQESAEARWKDVENIQAAIRNLEQENLELQVSEAWLRAVASARLDSAIAAAQQRVAQDTLLGVCTAETEANKALLESLVKLKDLRGKNDGLRMAQETQEAWAEVRNELRDGIANAIVDAFEEGGDASKNFFRNLERLAKGTVLKILYQFVQSGAGMVLNAVAGSVMGTGAVNGGSAGMNVLNSASTLSNLYGASTGYSGWVNSAASWLGAGSTAGAATGSLAYANMVGAAGGDAMGAFIASNGSWSGVAAGSSLGGAAAGEGVAAGSAAAGAGSTAAAAIPIIGWIIAGIMASLAAYKGGATHEMLSGSNSRYATPGGSIAGSHYKVFKSLGMNDKWANVLSGESLVARLLGHKASVSGFGVGTVQDGDFVQGDSAPLSFGANVMKGGADPWLQGLAGNITGGVALTAKRFGGGLTQGMRFGMLTDRDRENEVAALAGFFGADNRLLAGTQTGSGAFGAGGPGGAASKIKAEELEAWIAEQMPVLMIQGLQQSNLDKRFQDYFSSVSAKDLDAATATEMLDIANNVVMLTESFKPLGGVFAKLGDLSVKMTMDLAEASGGFDALGGKIASYYQNFYSDQEKVDNAWANINATLKDAGLTTPKTRDAFRALVDAQDLTTTSGQAAFTALMSVADSFAILTDNSAKLKAVADERAGLELQLMELTGDIVGIRKRERDALDESNRALYDQVKMAEDKIAADRKIKEVAEETIKAQKDAAEAAERHARTLREAWDSMVQDLASGVASAYGEVEKEVASAKDAVTRKADADLDLLERQSETVKSALEKTLANFQRFIDAIESNVLNLTDSMAKDGGEALAKATLTEAMEALRAGQTIDFDKVQRAAGVASRIDMDKFATASAFRAAAAGTVNLLRDVQKAANKPMADASAQAAATLLDITAKMDVVKLSRDSQLAVLDQQLNTAKSQYEALLGIQSGVGGVAGAVAALGQALSAYAGATGKGGTAGVQVAPEQWATSGNTSTWVSKGGAVAVAPVGGGMSDTVIKGLHSSFTGQEALDFIYANIASGNFRAIYDRAKLEGISLNSIDALMGRPIGSAADYARSQGWPVFAMGGMHAGGLRMVGENGPELEATGAARYFTADQTMSMLSGGARGDSGVLDMLQRIFRAIDDANQFSKTSQIAAVVAARETADVLDKWDRDGLPAERT